MGATPFNAPLQPRAGVIWDLWKCRLWRKNHARSPFCKSYWLGGSLTALPGYASHHRASGPPEDSPMRRFLLPGAPQISRLPPIPLPFSSRVKDTTYLHLSFPPRERRLLCFSSRLYVRPTDAHNSSFEKVSALRESVPFSSVRSNGERPQESEEVPSRSAGKGTKSTGKLHTGDSGAVAAEHPRVSLFEFLAFLKDEKFRVAGIMFALLLSSGAQLLLPLAVGKLVDAVTETTGDQHEKQQQQQQPEVAQLQQQEDEQQDQRREDSFHRQSSVTEGSNKVAAATDTPSAPATTAAGEPPPVVGRGKPEIATATEPSWRGLTGVFEENLKTPGARLGICVALGTVGAVTSFTRLYLLESTVGRLPLLAASSFGPEGTITYLLGCKLWSSSLHAFPLRLNGSLAVFAPLCSGGYSIRQHSIHNNSSWDP